MDRLLIVDANCASVIRNVNTMCQYIVYMFKSLTMHRMSSMSARTTAFGKPGLLKRSPKGFCRGLVGPPRSLKRSCIHPLTLAQDRACEVGAQVSGVPTRYAP